MLGRHRHDGDLLGRLQRTPGRGAAAAGAQGDHHALLDRRPLRRRCPLHGRLPAQREPAVGLDPARARGVSARSGDRGRALARDVARADREPGGLSGALAGAPVAGRVLAARLGLRGLWRDPLRGLRDRRLGGWLFQRGAPAAQGAEVPEKGPGRALGAPVSPEWRAGPADRVPAGSGPLVGSLAQGHRSRDHGRARVPGLDAGERRSAALLRGAARALGRRGRLALAPDRAAAGCSSTPAGSSRRRPRRPGSPSPRPRPPA